MSTENSNSKTFSVYMHTFPNGKRYIGITHDIKRRFRNGKGYEHQIVYNAIKKYGWNSVKTTVLYENLPEPEAKRREMELISQYNTTDNRYGYNQTFGGEGANGRHVSDENKRKIGERMSKIHKGIPLSQEHRKKISETLKGKEKHYSEEGRKKIVESNRNRVYSDETRKKMSENTKRAMAEKHINEYLKYKWETEKEIRKAKLRITNYKRHGIIPLKYDLKDDVIMLGLDKSDFPELFDQ